MNNNTNNAANVFEMLENVNNFRVDIDLSRAAIELSQPVSGGHLITADKARLTMLNRVNRCKRFAKLNALNDAALSIISTNTTPVLIEKAAIYTVDKNIQLAKFLAGDETVFGRGKNNSLLYLISGIAKNTPSMLTNDLARQYTANGGQPLESVDTQAVSSCKALLVFNCLTMIKAGVCTLNDTPLMSLLLSHAALKTTRRA